MDPREALEVVEQHLSPRAIGRGWDLWGRGVYSMRMRVKLGDLLLRPSAKRESRPSTYFVNLARLLFPVTACSYADMVRDGSWYLRSGYWGLAEETFGRCVRDVELAGGGPAGLSAFLTTPVASSVLSVLTTRARRPGAQPGGSFTVYGEPGCGKTTLTFWSVAAPLLAIGIDFYTVKRVVDALWVVADADRYISLLELAAELAPKRRSLPFIVFDDAGVGLSKYMYFTEADKAMRVSKLLQVSREGSGIMVFLAVPEMLLKVFRKTPGSRVIGRSFLFGPYVYTVWAEEAGRDPIERVRKRGDTFATVHPVMKTPDEVLDRWTEVKRRIRLELIEEERRASRRARKTLRSSGGHSLTFPSLGW